MRIVVAALCASLVAMGGCDAKEGPIKTKSRDPDAPPPIAAAERDSGTKACVAYELRVCACVEAKPDLADECKLAKARPAALAELLNMLDGKTANLGPKAKRMTLFTARKTIRKCFEADAELDPAICPRVSPRVSP